MSQPNFEASHSDLKGESIAVCKNAMSNAKLIKPALTGQPIESAVNQNDRKRVMPEYKRAVKIPRLQNKTELLLKSMMETPLIRPKPNLSRQARPNPLPVFKSAESRTSCLERPDKELMSRENAKGKTFNAKADVDMRFRKGILHLYRPISAEPKKKVTFADNENEIHYVWKIEGERQNVYRKKLLELANSGVLGSQNVLG